MVVAPNHPTQPHPSPPRVDRKRRLGRAANSGRFVIRLFGQLLHSSRALCGRPLGERERAIWELNTLGSGAVLTAARLRQMCPGPWSLSLVAALDTLCFLD